MSHCTPVNLGEGEWGAGAACVTSNLPGKVAMEIRTHHEWAADAPIVWLCLPARLLAFSPRSKAESLRSCHNGRIWDRLLSRHGSIDVFRWTWWLFVGVGADEGFWLDSF